MPREKRELAGRITISRPSGADKEHIYIEVIDAAAGVRFCEVRMPLDDFAKAVTGQGWVPCDLIVRGLDLVGTRAENKTETIYIDGDLDYKAKLKYAAKRVKELEVDGWKAREGDVTNHHNWTNDSVRVVFFRNVREDANGREA